MTSARITLVDRIFACLLLVFGLLHSLGSLKAYAFLSSELVWALAATCLAVLIAILNLVRAGRPHDATVAWICFASCIVWAILAVSFGVSIGNVLDPRPALHAVVAIVLAAFSLNTAISGGKTP